MNLGPYALEFALGQFVLSPCVLVLVRWTLDLGTSAFDFITCALGLVPCALGLGP